MDLSLSYRGQQPAGLDLSVVNVFNLTQSPRHDKCAFSVVGVKGSGVLKNGFFFVNTSIDMTNSSYSSCSELYISPFGYVNGSMQNITVTGFVNITNLNAGGFMNSSVPIRLSTFFGNLNLTNNSAGGDRYVGGPMLQNLSYTSPQHMFK